MAKWETPTTEGRDQWLQLLRRLTSLLDGDYTFRLSVRGRLPWRWMLERVEEDACERQAG